MGLLFSKESKDTKKPHNLPNQKIKKCPWDYTEEKQYFLPKKHVNDFQIFIINENNKANFFY